jgi:hypothetical protein
MEPRMSSPASTVPLPPTPPPPAAAEVMVGGEVAAAVAEAAVVLEGEGMGGINAGEEAEALNPAPTLPIILPHRDVVDEEVVVVVVVVMDCVAKI